jgi:hypothetical protein
MPSIWTLLRNMPLSWRCNPLGCCDTFVLMRSYLFSSLCSSRYASRRREMLAEVIDPGDLSVFDAVQSLVALHPLANNRSCRSQMPFRPSRLSLETEPPDTGSRATCRGHSVVRMMTCTLASLTTITKSSAPSVPLISYDNYCRDYPRSA